MLYLIIFSTFAISLFYLIVDRMGYTQNNTLESIEYAKQVFANEYTGIEPLSDIRTLILAQDRQGALFEFEHSKQLGILFALGTGWVVKLFTVDQVTSVTLNELNLEIIFNDYSLPSYQFTFQNTEQSQYWYHLIHN